MQDNFEFNLVNVIEGYISSVDKTNASEKILVRGSRNVYKKLSGNIAARPGLLRRGAADATVSGVKSSYEWNTSLGQVRPMRVTEAGLLQVEYTNTNISSGAHNWYTLQSALTKTRFIFDTWWDNVEAKDKLLMVKGDADMGDWSGGISLMDTGYASALFIIGNSASEILFSLTNSNTSSITTSTNSLKGTSTQAVVVLKTNPTNGDTLGLVINGQTVSIQFVTPIGAVAGNVLIGATVADTLTNLIGLLKAPNTTNATQRALSAGNQTLVNYMFYESTKALIKSDTATTWAQDGFALNPGQYSSSNIDFVASANAANAVVEDAGANFITAGFKIGDKVAVGGSASNDGVYTISLVQATLMQITGNFIAEAAGAKIMLKTARDILINGNSYSYAGNTQGTILAIVSGNPASETTLSVVLQAVQTHTNLISTAYNMDFIRSNNNMIHIGSYSSRFFYISANDDFRNYVVPSPRTPGDPELLTLDNAPTGMGVRQGNAHIGAGTSDWYVITFNQITVNTTLTEQTVVTKQTGSALSAPLAHEFIDTIGDDIIYLSQDQQLRQFGTFRNLSQPRYPSISQAVQDELASIDFTGGHLRSVADFIYITAPVSGIDYMHQTRQSVDLLGNIVSERIWHPPQIRNLSRIAVISGVVYGHSNANPQIYQMWDTNQWHDDSSSDEPLPYACVARMSYRSQGRRQGILRFDKAYFEGYLTQGANLYANVFEDYQGSTGISNLIINGVLSPASFFSSEFDPSLGDSSPGDNPLGQGLTQEEIDQELLPKFRVITDINPANCFEYEIEVYSVDLDCRWEIIALGLNAMKSTEQAVFIRK